MDVLRGHLLCVAEGAKDSVRNPNCGFRSFSNLHNAIELITSRAVGEHQRSHKFLHVIGLRSKVLQEHRLKRQLIFS